MRSMHALPLALAAAGFASPAIAQAAVDACGELTGLQVAAGFVTWMNVLRVFALAVGAACVGILLVRFCRNIPIEAYLGLGYLASFALIASGMLVDPVNQTWPVFGGSLLFGAVLFSGSALYSARMSPSANFAVLAVAWAAVAAFYLDGAVGFLAVAAFMGALGFSAAVVPMGYVLGFTDDRELHRATSAGFAVLALYVAVTLTGIESPYLDVFEQGALWMGSFVGFLGVLIMSSRFYDGGLPYAARQAVAVVAGMAAIAVGSLLQMPQMLGIGGTFFALYLIEKPFDLPVKSLTGFALVGLASSAAVGAAVFWAQNNMHIVEPYLLF